MSPNGPPLAPQPSEHADGGPFTVADIQARWANAPTWHDGWAASKDIKWLIAGLTAAEATRLQVEQELIALRNELNADAHDHDPKTQIAARRRAFHLLKAANWQEGLSRIHLLLTAEANRAALIAQLAAHEWTAHDSSGHDEDRCHVCREYRLPPYGNGHKPNCWLANVLAEARAVVGSPVSESEVLNHEQQRGHAPPNALDSGGLDGLARDDRSLQDTFTAAALSAIRQWSFHTPASYAQRDDTERFQYAIWVAVKQLIERGARLGPAGPPDGK